MIIYLETNINTAYFCHSPAHSSSHTLWVYAVILCSFSSQFHIWKTHWNPRGVCTVTLSHYKSASICCLSFHCPQCITLSSSLSSGWTWLKNMHSNILVDDQLALLWCLCCSLFSLCLLSVTEDRAQLHHTEWTGGRSEVRLDVVTIDLLMYEQ